MWDSEDYHTDWSYGFEIEWTNFLGTHHWKVACLIIASKSMKINEDTEWKLLLTCSWISTANWRHLKFQTLNISGLQETTVNRRWYLFGMLIICWKKRRKASYVISRSNVDAMIKHPRKATLCQLITLCWVIKTFPDTQLHGWQTFTMYIYSTI